MRDFTQKDYKKLQPFESHLNRGFYGKYYYALNRSVFGKLLEIYRDLGYTQSMDYSCGRCILNLTSTLGRLYFEYEKKMEETPESVKNTSKRKVGTFNDKNELLKEYESVTQAIDETGITKSDIYKSLKDNVPVDGVIYRYI